jgi:hypothetical protein
MVVAMMPVATMLMMTIVTATPLRASAPGQFQCVISFADALRYQQ